MEVIFNNKYLPVKVIVLILMIGFLSYYSHSAGQRKLTLEQCLNDPERYDGSKIEIGSERKVGSIESGRFELVQGKRTIWVKGTVEHLKENEYINLEGVFHKEGYLEIKKVHILKLRRLKIAISVVPVLIVAWLFFRNYRFKWREMAFLEK